MKKEVLMSIALLAIVGTIAAFAQTPTLDKLKFSTNASGEMVAQPANNQISGAVVIPDTYNGKPVTRVNGFLGIKGITSIILPASLTEIPANAFNRTNIRSITILASVTKVGGSAFENCDNLTSVTFLGSNTDIGTKNSVNPAFRHDLPSKYQAGGAGTYTRQTGGTVWTKQGGAVCSCCGQPLPSGVKR